MLGFYKTLLIRSFKKRGFFGTLLFILSEFFFDLRYGTDTTSIVEVDDLEISDADKKSVFKYQASNYWVVRKLLNKLQINFSQSTLIDFGSGKGRLLLVALEYGFRGLIGVEISKILCDIFENNLQIYRKYNKKYDNTSVEIVNMNAAKYQIPNNANIFCFYNPFAEDIFSAVIDNIEKSISIRNRKIYILYLNPIYMNILNIRHFHCYFDLSGEAMIFTNDCKNHDEINLSFK